MKKIYCKMCRCFTGNPGAGPGNGFCNKNPPIPLGIPSHNRMTGEMSFSVQAVNPPVTGDSFCYSGEAIPKLLDS